MAEILAVIAKLSELTFILTSMLAKGLSLTIKQIIDPLRNVRVALLAHGISANPRVKLYTRSIANLEADALDYAEVGGKR